MKRDWEDTIPAAPAPITATLFFLSGMMIIVYLDQKS